jgi:hypothetical protein
MMTDVSPHRRITLFPITAMDAIADSVSLVFLTIHSLSFPLMMDSPRPASSSVPGLQLGK